MLHIFHAVIKGGAVNQQHNCVLKPGSSKVKGEGHERSAEEQIPPGGGCWHLADAPECHQLIEMLRA